MKVSSVDVDAVGLGDDILYQPYFVCIRQGDEATIIEYGKSQGTTEKGEIYLSMIDKESPLHVRFYAFGNGEDELEVTDAQILKLSLTSADCRGDTTKDEGTNMCVQKCHEMCDPLKGMPGYSNVVALKFIFCLDCGSLRKHNQFTLGYKILDKGNLYLDQIRNVTSLGKTQFCACC